MIFTQIPNEQLPTNLEWVSSTMSGDGVIMFMVGVGDFNSDSGKTYLYKSINSGNNWVFVRTDDCWGLAFKPQIVCDLTATNILYSTTKILLYSNDGLATGFKTAILPLDNIIIKKINSVAIGKSKTEEQVNMYCTIRGSDGSPYSSINQIFRINTSGVNWTYCYEGIPNFFISRITASTENGYVYTYTHSGNSIDNNKLTSVSYGDDWKKLPFTEINSELGYLPTVVNTDSTGRIVVLSITDQRNFKVLKSVDYGVTYNIITNSGSAVTGPSNIDKQGEYVLYISSRFTELNIFLKDITKMRGDKTQLSTKSHQWSTLGLNESSVLNPLIVLAGTLSEGVFIGKN